MTPEQQQRERELKRWEWAIAQMRKYMELNAPPVIKAHLLVKVLIPRLARISGCVPQVATELSGLICEKMLEYTGLCKDCNKVDATSEEGFCPKCQAQFDQVMADYDSEGYDLDDEEFE